MDTIEHVAGQMEMFYECGHCERLIADGVTDSVHLFWMGDQATRFCNESCAGNHASNQEG